MKRDENGQFVSEWEDSFLKPEIHKCDGFECDMPDGSTEFVPSFVTGGNPSTESLGLYCSDEPERFRKRYGYYYRVSAPGYLDCSDWCYSTNEREAIEQCRFIAGIDE